MKKRVDPDFIEVKTQAELEKVTARGDVAVVTSGNFWAYGSASVRAYGSASVTAYGSASVRASQYVPVQVHPNTWGDKVKVKGGILIELPVIDTVEKWLEFHDVTVKRGNAVLFKAVDKNFKSPHGTYYTPGSKPTAPDWDGGAAECGGGLHFCAFPHIAAAYNSNATRYVGCPVKVSDIVLHADGDTQKVKAPRVSGKCFEVDINGDPV